MRDEEAIENLKELRRLAKNLVLISDLELKDVEEEELPFNPPICPYCKKPLNIVWETVYETYKFNPLTGQYELDEYASEAEIRCSHCACKLNDLFEYGVCNYQAGEAS